MYRVHNCRATNKYANAGGESKREGGLSNELIMTFNEQENLLYAIYMFMYQSVENRNLANIWIALDK